MSSIYQQVRGGLADLSKATLPARAAINDALESVLDRAGQMFSDLSKAAFPAKTPEQQKISRLLDDGYGEHFLNAYHDLQAGKRVHADDLKILKRYGLAGE